MSTDAKFARRVSELRRKTGLNQAEFAHLLGLSRNYVSMIEGGREPSDAIRRLIDELEEQWRDADLIRGNARDLVQRALRRRKLDLGGLARLTGYSAGVLGAVVEGNGRASERMIHKICTALDLDPAEILAGSDTPAAREVPVGTFGATPELVTGPDVGRPKYVPLISMAQAGTMPIASFTDGGYSHEGTVAFDPKDSKAFGVRITGDSMAPIYTSGDIAIVYPSSQPRSGDLVIARMRDEAGDGVFFKLYTPKAGGDLVVLTSYNPAYPALELSRRDFLWIYPVVAVTKILRNQ